MVSAAFRHFPETMATARACRVPAVFDQAVIDAGLDQYKEIFTMLKVHTISDFACVCPYNAVTQANEDKWQKKNKLKWTALLWIHSQTPCSEWS